MSDPAHERGWMAEFHTASEVAAAGRRMRELGYRRMEIFSPFEVSGADEILEVPRPQKLPRLVLVFGLLGAATGYLIQSYAAVLAYPINVGGRPLHSVPAFVPITFESGVLFGAFAAFIGLYALARLPRLWQPVFEVEGFERVSDDGYWLAVDAGDRHFEATRTREELLALGPRRVERLGGDA